MQGVVIQGFAASTLNGAVRKSGCATRERSGNISDNNAPNIQAGNITLTNQLLIQRDNLPDPLPNEVFQVKGDSGSVALDHNNMVVALLHGQASATVVQGTHITPILLHFGAAVLVGNMQAP